MVPPSTAKTWFRTSVGRRYLWEIGLVIVVKLAMLTLLWFAFIAPWSTAAKPVAAAVAQFYRPAHAPIRHD
jgi:uncharacterized protein YggT (Ycf19 family)